MINAVNEIRQSLSGSRILEGTLGLGKQCLGDARSLPILQTPGNGIVMEGFFRNPPL
ncbi:hypothetical protein SAMN05444515_10614 [Ectothiorhodospira marina]|uniref:Uncharacterized protein n=1 Tax=Ectothiorhodospira marina TaxID=1396821 RepID=A0A1H7KKT8_9GAMM|nr:hypothetical protein SAMN05444515_10614 [Ectothiorhodospira marina]